MKTTMINIVLFLLLGLVLLNILMYLRQPGMTFFPSRDVTATPVVWGLAYEDVVLTTRDDVKLHGWFIPAENSNKALLFLHGNGGNIAHRGESLLIFHRLGLNVLIIDYRGYGRSEGSSSERGVYQDAAAAWGFLKNKGYDSDDIVIFGRSLGGVVAAQLASQVQPAALILESTFSSARDVAQSIFPLLSRLVWMRYEFDAEKYVAQVSSPVLVLHSPQDEIIPYALGEKVFQAANEPKRFVKLLGDHNSGFLFSQPRYSQELDNFIAKHR